VEKYCTAGQATDDNTTRRMRTACWITKATDTNSEYVILNAFPANNGYANAPQWYLYTMLPDIPVKADLRSTQCTQLCSGKLSISQNMYYSPAVVPCTGFPEILQLQQNLSRNRDEHCNVSKIFNICALIQCNLVITFYYWTFSDRLQCRFRVQPPFLLRLLFLNSSIFSGHMISAVSIKHAQINCPTVKILYMVAIKLANIKPPSTVD
jgi:hypothetical protein